MKNWFFLFISLALLFSLSVCEETVDQQKSENGTEPAATNETTEVILTAAEYINTAFIFPHSPEKDIIIGNTVEILLGIANSGESAINVTSIIASLRYPPDWRYIIQNFTKMAYSVIVKPGEQTSFLYSFKPDPLLEPRDFGLSAQVFYHDQEGTNFTSFFFNNTVPLVESSESIDAQSLFTYVGIVGIAGLILFIIYKAVGERRMKRPAKLETGTQNKDVIDDEWLEGTHAKPKSPKGQRSPTKSRKVKDS